MGSEHIRQALNVDLDSAEMRAKINEKNASSSWCQINARAL
jgi:hypothetical protein